MAAEAWAANPTANATYHAAYAAHASANAAANYAANYAANAANAAANAANAANAAAYAAATRQQKWGWLYATYRHAHGPEGLVFDPFWRTETAVALARGIVSDRDFTRMPYLADALQDVGCDCAELMTHLQTDAAEWTCADWALWNLLGYGEEK